MSEIKPIIQDARFVKEFAKTSEIPLGGATNSELKGIQAQADLTCISLYEQNSSYIDSKRADITLAFENDPRFNDHTGAELNALVDESFEQGFSRFIKSQYRLFKREDTSSISKLHDNEYLSTQAIAYFFDFYRAFSLATKMGTSPLVALDYAQKVYFHDPDMLPQMIKKYPDLNKTGIFIAILNNPSNPDKWVSNMENRIIRLKEEFPDVDEGILQRAAYNYPKNPSQYVADYLNLIDNLTIEFPSVPFYVVKEAATIHTKVARNYLQQFCSLLPELRQKFPELEEFVIVKAASTYNKRAVEWLQNIVNRTPDLIAEFPNLPPHMITRALFTSNKPERYLRRVESNYEILKSKFPDFSNKLLYEFAYNYSDLNKAVTKLEKILASIEEYKERFSTFTEADILSIITSRSGEDHSDLLESLEKRAAEYKSKHPTVPNHLLSYVFANNSDPEIKLDQILQARKDLQREFPQLPSHLIEYLAVFHPKDSSSFVNNQLSLVDSYQEKFPTVSRERIIAALIRNSRDPENYIRQIL
jgi:hypothetical protein